MRIGIDARILGHPRSGIAVYVTNLVEQFLKHKDLEVILFGDRPICEEYKYITDRVKTVIFGQAHRKRCAQFYLPGQLKKYKIDIYHATWNSAVPIFTRVPSVLTLHDIIPVMVPGYFTKASKKIKFLLQTYFSLHKAAYVITVSECEKNTINKKMFINPKKIGVTYNAVDEIFKKDSNFEQMQDCFKKYNIDYDYIINGGGVNQPKRNTVNLINAFFEFSKKYPDVKLILVGDNRENNAYMLKVKKTIAELELENKVVFLGQIVKEDVFLLLKGAKIMVFPSLYESFGIPILEAMAVGTPVISSDLSSIPEIAGKAAKLVNSNFHDEIAKAMEEIYTDNDIKNQFIKLGKEKVKDFSWEKTAQETISIYRKVLNTK